MLDGKAPRQKLQIEALMRHRQLGTKSKSHATRQTNSDTRANPAARSNKRSEDNRANVTTLLVKGLLHVALLCIYAEDRNSAETKAVCDTASPKTWKDECMIQFLDLAGRNTPVSLSGIHGTNSIERLKVPVKIRPADEISNTVKMKASTCKKIF